MDFSPRERYDQDALDFITFGRPAKGHPLQWLSLEWEGMKHGIHSLLLVSHQVSVEAAEIFFNQPFRFTSEFGWHLLYHFLDIIGPKGRTKLKDITVCHPGCSRLPGFRKDNEFENRLTMFGLGKSLLQVKREMKEKMGIQKAPAWAKDIRDPYLLLNESVLWTPQSTFDGPLRLLREATELRRFMLMLPRHLDMRFGTVSFPILARHPVHTFSWTQGNGLHLGIANLIDSTHNCDAESRRQPSIQDICMEELQGKTITYKDEQGMTITGESELPRFDLPRFDFADTKVGAREFFAKVEGLGWKVVEYMHDHNGHYPVKSNEICTNKSMCKFLANSASNSYCCPGNLEEQVDHGSYDTVERRKIREAER